MRGRALLNRVRSRRQIRGSGHVIDANEAVLRRVSFDISGCDNRVTVAPNARLHDVEVKMRGEGHRLEIGEHVQIWRGSFAFEDRGCRVTLGERTVVYDMTVGATEGRSIDIGRGCLISEQVDVRSGDSHSIVDAKSGARINHAADVVISDNVWLGARSMVLKGTTIGAHSVIAAGAVVSGAIPAGCVAAGVPARPVATGVEWRHERL